MIGAGFIEDLKLTPGRFEPSICFTIKNDRENALRLRLKFLRREKASFKTAKEVLRHITFIFGRYLEIPGWFRLRIGALL